MVQRLLKILCQVGDLAVTQGEPQVPVGRVEGVAARREDVDGTQRPRLCMIEQGRGLIDARDDRLGHPIVNAGREDRLEPPVAPGLAGAGLYPPLDASFHPAHLVEPAVVHDVGGLAGPGGDRAGAGHHQKAGTAAGAPGSRSRIEKAGEQGAIVVVEGIAVLDEVDEMRAEG